LNYSDYGTSVLQCVILVFPAYCTHINDIHGYREPAWN
jgi:hypothetical protein